MEKVGKDVIRKRMKRLLDTNEISIQLAVLGELSKRKMNCQELRQLVDQLGGDYDNLMPILKKSGLIRAERIKDGRRGRKYVYSAA